jgi:membrane-bound lytic murein transglycosylase A
MKKHTRLFLSCVLASCLLTSCGTSPQSPVTPADQANLRLTPASYGDLRGWQTDSQSLAVQAFAKSCKRIAARKAAETFGPIGGTYGDWQNVCAKITPDLFTNEVTARAFFENNFNVWRASADTGAKEGLFTGYYEASLKGSRTRHGPYQTPLRKRPGDLVMVDLGQFRDTLKGQRIAGRVVDGNLKPFEDHRAIDAGKLPNDDSLPLVYVDDPVAAFFLQIQGSGQVLLDDGTIMRVGYAGQNGHPYYAVGRELVKRNLMSKDDVTMQSIAAWLKAHPDQAKDILYTNPSYVFFTELTGDGPLGGENVALTTERSIAVDRSRVAYGIPVWLDLQDQDYKRLMIAQDTGGAIRGPIRGDIFFGYGERAEQLAGPMKSQGQWWFLLPKSVTQ